MRMQPAPLVRRGAAVALALAALGCGAADPLAPGASRAPVPDAPAFAAGGNAQVVPFALSVVGTCSGETVDVTGEMTITTAWHVDGGGGWHWFQNYVMRGTATGQATGARYVFREVHNMKENGTTRFVESGSLYFTMSFISTLVSQGPAANELLQFDVRYKVSHDGTVVMDHLRLESACRG